MEDKCCFEGYYDREAIWDIYGVEYIGKGWKQCNYRGELKTKTNARHSMCLDRQGCPVWQEMEVESLKNRLGLDGITINGRPLVNKLIAQIKRRSR